MRIQLYVSFISAINASIKLKRIGAGVELHECFDSVSPYLDRSTVLGYVLSYIRQLKMGQYPVGGFADCAGPLPKTK
jgi:hypothetical protein